MGIQDLTWGGCNMDEALIMRMNNLELESHLISTGLQAFKCTVKAESIETGQKLVTYYYCKGCSNDKHERFVNMSRVAFLTVLVITEPIHK
jgi:hypothetical protein